MEQSSSREYFQFQIHISTITRPIDEIADKIKIPPRNVNRFRLPFCKETKTNK